MQVHQVAVPSWRLAGKSLVWFDFTSHVDSLLIVVLGSKSGPDKSQWPLLNFIVRKRHHDQFFPREDNPARDMKGNDNMLPVDTGKGGRPSYIPCLPLLPSSSMPRQDTRIRIL
jgi:hypothetical protein